MNCDHCGILADCPRCPECIATHGVPEGPTAIRCPRCGGGTDDGAIRYVEQIQCWRQVYGVTSAGVVKVDGGYQTGEGYDDGENAHFECRNDRTLTKAELDTERRRWRREGVSGEPEHTTWCGHTWPVPEWIQDRIDWT